MKPPSRIACARQEIVAIERTRHDRCLQAGDRLAVQAAPVTHGPFAQCPMKRWRDIFEGQAGHATNLPP
jgi:hypothetical protein